MAVGRAEPARQDLDQTRAYTLEQGAVARLLPWAGGYFERIEADPMTGRARDLFRPGMRSVGYERHVVFFAPLSAAGGAPMVLRVLHGRRNLAALAYHGGLDG